MRLLENEMRMMGRMLQVTGKDKLGNERARKSVKSGASNVTEQFLNILMGVQRGETKVVR